MPRPKSQRDRRRYQHFRDQHGRRWGAHVEKDSGDSTGPITPADWRPVDPRLLPPASYIHSVRDELGLLFIDYDEWEAALRLAQRDYETRLETMAMAMYGEKSQAAIKEPPPELLRVVGAEKPMAWQPIRAMKRGHPWALFGKGPRPEWADKYLPRSERSIEAEEKFLEEDETFDAEDAAEKERAQDERLKAVADKAAASMTDAEPCAYCGKDATTKAIMNGKEVDVCTSCAEITDARDTTEVDEDVDLDEEFDEDAEGGKRVPVKRTARIPKGKPARAGR